LHKDFNFCWFWIKVCQFKNKSVTSVVWNLSSTSLKIRLVKFLTTLLTTCADFLKEIKVNPYLLKSTILTSVPINSINNTLLISRTLIIHHWTLWASKKSFTSFACYDAIMNARWLITAHFTRDDFDLSCKKINRNKMN
jgi:hypothetical protein